MIEFPGSTSDRSTSNPAWLPDVTAVPAVVTSDSALDIDAAIAASIVRHGDPAVADAYCATRLAGDRGRALGTLPRGVPFTQIIERHRPRL